MPHTREAKPKTKDNLHEEQTNQEKTHPKSTHTKYEIKFLKFFKVISQIS
jgi:hypothetical protein